jgi:hypothetical protein
MKYIKMLGLAAVAAMALMAFAGTASATDLTSPAGTVYEGEIVATAESSLTLQAGFSTVTCTESTVAGTPNSFGATVSGPITTLDFSNCPETTVTPEKNAEGNYGTLSIAVDKKGPNGNLSGSGSRVKIVKSGVTCYYETSNTPLGTLTGSSTTGKTATMDINATLKRGTGSSFFCASEALWSGSYVVTTPHFLDIS